MHLLRAAFLAPAYSPSVTRLHVSALFLSNLCVTYIGMYDQQEQNFCLILLTIEFPVPRMVPGTWWVINKYELNEGIPPCPSPDWWYSGTDVVSHRGAWTGLGFL